MNLDRLIGVVVLVLTALLWWVIIPNEVKGFEQSLMPRLVTLLLGISALGLTLRPGPAKVSTDPAQVRGMVSVIGMMGVYLIYIIVIPTVGFFVSSGVALVVFLWLLGMRRVRILVGVPVVMLTSIWLIITELLQYPLPAGLLF